MRDEIGYCRHPLPDNLRGALDIIQKRSGCALSCHKSGFTPGQPVYDPGGLTGLVDDFAVVPGSWPTTGARLLQAALDVAAERGAVQAVVVTAHLDEPKRSMLRATGLQLTSEWWLTSTPHRRGID
jgi:hypothetical protein